LDDVDWICLVQESNLWRAVKNAVIEFVRKVAVHLGYGK
jgi:hypothetical protein